MKILTFIIFLLIAVSIYFLMHYYIYHRITRGFELSKIGRRWLALSLLLLALTFILGEVLNRIAPVYIIGYLGVVWLGVLSIGICVFILKDITALIFPRHIRLLTICAIALTFLSCAWSMANVACGYKIKHIKIHMRKLSPALSGFSIVHMTDLHLGALTSNRWLQKVVDDTNKLKPDLIVITGDLVNEDIGKSKNFSKILKKLHSKYGIYAVTGNHEYYVNFDKFIRFIKESNIELLQNENITIADEICLAGVNDDDGTRFSDGGPNLEKALEDCDTTKPIILLYHRPTNFKKAVANGVSLQLSGHTHAGQIPPVDLIVAIIYRYHCGLYRHLDSYIYTSSGTGIWGPPMRLFSRSEIVKITLENE